MANVKIIQNTPRGRHISGCRTGICVQFLEGSPSSKTGWSVRWNTRDAYLYLGPVGKSRFVRVLNLDNERVIEGVPRTQKVRTLRIVSIELEPFDGREDEEVD